MKKEKQEFRDYGIDEYVPEEARHYKFMDMVATWVGANCSPNTWYMGGCLAASGFAVAAGVTLLANPIAYLILALVGYIGYRVSTTSMGMMRFSLGINGSKIMTLINTVTLVGWNGVACYIGGISLSYIFNTVWGWPCYGMEGALGPMILGTLSIAFLTVIFVLIGGSKAVKLAENIAVVAMLIFSIWITVAVLGTFPLKDIFAWRPSEDIKLPVGIGIDTMVAYSLSWVPCVADFTRYCRNKRSATAAPVVGATLGVYWFALVGTVAAIASALTTGVFDPNASDPSSVAATLGLGVPAMFVIVLSAVTTNMISLYSSTFSTLNLMKKPMPIRKMNLIMSVVTILFALVPIAFATFLDFFYTFMDFLALVYPPMIAVLVVDYYLLRKGRYIQTEIGSETGPYWYRGGYNWYAIVSWLLGVVSFVLYKSIPPVLNSVGAVFPSLFTTAIVYYAAGKYAISKGAYQDLAKHSAR